ncbi:MAG: hypothetical protein ABSE75_09500 [Acidimicrobiales bacterium]|jgi:hypothetical protein
MSVVLAVVIGVVVALVIVIVTLRLRKLRRDEIRKIASRVDRRLMVPPPSPYTPSKGFRLLDGPINPEGARPEPPRPRLETDHDYVFSESQLSSYQEGVSPLGRRDERWALSKSARPARLAGFGARFGLIVLVILIVAIVGLYYAKHGNPPKTTTTTTTTLTSSSAAHSNVVWPSTLVASAASGDNATYRVPVSRYRVTVSGANGAVWTVYRMGPLNTLEWQGSIVKGTSESLVLSGVSKITLGSPHSASVKVGRSNVVFPSTLPATLTLVLRPPITSSG